MNVRTLAAEEFPLLKGVAEGTMPDPRTSVAIVVEDAEGQIVGRIFLIAPTHMEGPWIHEDARSGFMLGKLVSAAEQTARKFGIKTLFAYGASDYLENLLLRLGYRKQKLTVWSKEI